MEDLNFLTDFITQADTGDLKTSTYPKEFFELKMKTSFGMGTAARIPWISFTAPGMTVGNGYYPGYLFYKEQNVLLLTYGVSETNDYDETWPNEIVENKAKVSSVIHKPYRYGKSYVYKYYKPIVKSEKLVFLDESDNELSLEDLKNDLVEILNYYKKVLDINIKDESSTVSTGLFYMEKQLEDFIIDNWDYTELGKKYNLIIEDGTLKSRQYRTDVGLIDILATDKETGSYVVIELKRNQTSDDTVGQVARYMGWIKESKNDKDVKGVIIAGKYDRRLYYAVSMLDNVDVFLYEVSFNLKEHSPT
jgi:RecB family endonuclease NucS